MVKAIKNIIKYKDFILYSTRSELKAEVGGAYLNWTWWLLEPVCYVLIYALVFGVIMQRPEPFFILFLFLGISLWEFFSKSINASVRMIRSNKAIISKVYLPKYILAISKLLVSLFKMVVSWFIIIALMIYYGLSINIYFFWLIPLLFVFCIIIFSFMCVIMHLGVFIDDLPNIINIVLRVTMLLTGIFFSIPALLPDWRGELLVSLNPVAFIVNGFREVILNGRQPNLIVLGIWLGVSILVAFIGIRLITKYENTYVKVI